MTCDPRVFPVEYSLVVPAYNSGLWLDELVERVGAVMEAEAPGRFELILVNDCSPNEVTWTAIVRSAKKYSWVRGVNLLYNVGQFKATLCGFEQSRGRFILTLDDDLQHPPEELPKLISAMRRNPSMDCIMGLYSVGGKKHSFVRNIGSALVQRMLSRLYNKTGDVTTTSFRIMTAEFAKTLTLYRIHAPQLGPLIVLLTRRVMNVPVEHHARTHGKSGYSLFRCVQEVLSGVVNASVVPLRVFSVIGFFAATCSFLIGGTYLVRWLLGGMGVRGYTSTVLILTFCSGLILCGIGLLGEYVGRLISEVTGMPRYAIRERTDSPHE